VWHVFVVDVPGRDQVQAKLREEGVESLIHYPVPPHLSEAYAADQAWGSYPVTERAARTHLSLPMGPHLSIEQQGRIIDAVVRTLRRLCGPEE
jgi:dTDP-4-amino-4,6-dideoxygalactose transaminase